MSGAVLVVDDDREFCEVVQLKLERSGYSVETQTTREGAEAALHERDFDLVLLDLQLGDSNGLGLCEWVVKNREDVPVIVITGFGSMDTAVGALRAGAYDFITKPVDLELLTLNVRRALRHRGLNEEVQRLRRAAERPEPLPGLVGESPAMRKLASLIDRISDSDATVLITGESGTGKELVASALHKRSKRRDGPFVAVNCAALSPTLLESELFGHVRGAFTDARSTRQGLLREADGGTLFMDELAEMSLDMQVKLLRALQERKVRPVGGSEEYSFNAQIVAATNRDIESDVEQGKFREDLYFRVNVVRIKVPPLRARGNDVLVLAHHFLDRIAARTDKPAKSISAPAAQMLANYGWPGNVRELENTMERSVALARGDTVTPEGLPERVREYRSDYVVLAGDNPDELLSLAELEKRYIERVLKTVDGNKTEAARVLDIDRRTLYRKLERYEHSDGSDAESTG